MDLQLILEAIHEAERNSQQHYAETVDWCERTGFPLDLIAKPDYGASVPLAFGARPFERARHHIKGNGWKANHTS